jgi:hypothetical protein
MGDEREASRNAETIYAPANPKTKSASELYREASQVQADAMRSLAGMLEAARSALGAAMLPDWSKAAVGVTKEQAEAGIARAASLVHDVERALLLIAAELVRHD